MDFEIQGVPVWNLVRTVSSIPEDSRYLSLNFVAKRTGGHNLSSGRSIVMLKSRCSSDLVSCLRHDQSRLKILNFTEARVFHR
jgi:hypothetical protein